MKKFLATWSVLMLFSLPGWTQTLTRAEYFFDADPGQGNGVSLTIAPGTNISSAISVSTASLGAGFHTLNVRVRSDADAWSLFASRTFYILPPSAAPVPSSQVVAAEVFIDDDPGAGNGVAVSFSPSGTLTIPVVVPVSSLSHGFHTVNVRIKDDQDRWSLFAQRSFYVMPPVSGTGLSTTITRAEYFFDSDPGVGNATSLPITSAALQSNQFMLDVSGLTPGFHRLAIRYRDDQHVWSHFANRNFYVISANLMAPSSIKQFEYFIDADPAVNPSLDGTGVAATPSATVSQHMLIDLAGVPSGVHTLYLRAKDDKGFWSTVAKREFTIISCTPPSPPTAASVTRCGSGAVTLVAIGASASNQYRWYEDQTSNTVLSIGSEFVTPVLTASRGYFVSIFDPATLCESNRVSVAASVILASKPVVNPSGALSLCEGSSAILSAPAGFAQYVWSTGEATRQIFVQSGGKYTVQVGDGNCLSPASDTVHVSVINAVSKPMVSASGPLTFCNGGSVTLSAPAGFSQYIWSNGETTREILATASANYSVKVGNGSCTSGPSDNITVLVSAVPAQATISASGPLAFCQGGSVILSAPAGSSRYIWSSGETTRQILVNAAGRFSVRAEDGNCPGAASDTVEVIVLSPPSKPVLTVAGNTTICGNGSVSLSGPSAYSYLWSNGETTQSIQPTVSGAYTLRVFTTPGCLSVSSDPVVITFLTPPCGPVVTNQPPAIDSSPLASPIEGVVSIDLTKIITDADANLDFNTLKLLSGRTARGASAFIDASYHLTVDYAGLPFTGTDRLTIEICDLAGACVQQVLDIAVVGAVVVHNGVSPDGDGKNDFLLLKYVDVVEGAGKNKVTIMNRWGSVVFEVSDYDNMERVFRGVGNNGNELPSGTYFYRIEFQGASKPQTGFLTLKR